MATFSAYGGRLTTFHIVFRHIVFRHHRPSPSCLGTPSFAQIYGCHAELDAFCAEPDLLRVVGTRRTTLSQPVEEAKVMQGAVAATFGGAVAYVGKGPFDVRYVDEHLCIVQCSDIFTLRNEKLHTKT